MNGEVFAQYGAIGFIAILAIGAVRILYARLDKAYTAEKERSDRLESELIRLNEIIRTQNLASLTQAAQATSEATRAVADVLALLRSQGKP